jgi:hypothetical protein
MSRKPTQSKPASRAHDTMAGGASSSTVNAARPIGCAIDFLTFRPSESANSTRRDWLA